MNCKELLISQDHDHLIDFLKKNPHDIDKVDEYGWSTLAYAMFWLEDKESKDILIDFGANLSESLAGYLTIESPRNEVIELYLRETNIDLVCERLIANNQLTANILSLIHQTYRLDLSALGQSIANFSLRSSNEAILIYLINNNITIHSDNIGLKLIQNIFLVSDNQLRKKMLVMKIVKEEDLDTLYYKHAIESNDYELFQLLLSSGVRPIANDETCNFILDAEESLQKIVLDQASESFVAFILLKTLESINDEFSNVFVPSRNINFLNILFQTQQKLVCDNVELVLSVFLDSQKPIRQSFLDAKLLVLDTKMVQTLVDEALLRHDENLLSLAIHSQQPFSLEKKQYIEFPNFVLMKENFMSDILSCAYIDKKILLNTLLEVVPQASAVQCIEFLLDYGIVFDSDANQDQLQKLFIIASYRQKILNDVIRIDYRAVLQEVIATKNLELLRELISMGIDIKAYESILEDAIQLLYDDSQYKHIEKIYGTDIGNYSNQKIQKITAYLFSFPLKKTLEDIDQLISTKEEKEENLEFTESYLSTDYISVGDEDERNINQSKYWGVKFEREISEIKDSLTVKKETLKQFLKDLDRGIDFVIFFFGYFPREAIQAFEDILQNIEKIYEEVQHEINIIDESRAAIFSLPDALGEYYKKTQAILQQKIDALEDAIGLNDLVAIKKIVRQAPLKFLSMEQFISAITISKDIDITEYLVSHYEYIVEIGDEEKVEDKSSVEQGYEQELLSSKSEFLKKYHNFFSEYQFVNVMLKLKDINLIKFLLKNRESLLNDASIDISDEEIPF